MGVDIVSYVVIVVRVCNLDKRSTIKVFVLQVFSPYGEEILSPGHVTSSTNHSDNLVSTDFSSNNSPAHSTREFSP